MILMNTISRSVRVIFLGLVTFLAATAAEAQFVYLNPNSVDIRSFPAAPVNGSSEDRADLDGVRKLQKTRTGAECARATDEAGASLKSFYGMSHAVLSSRELAAVATLFEEIGDDASEFISPVKNQWRRPRPFRRDPKIRICVPSVSGYSYPSGHATLARVSARAFGLIFPDRARALLTRGNEIGRDRVIGAVHHPIDVQEGNHLGDEIFDALIKSSEFMHRIDEIRAELGSSRTSR